MKIKYLNIAFFFLLVAFSLSPAFGQKPERAVRAADQAWLKVFAAKDPKASVDFFLPDGSVLAPNAPIATGHKAIGEAFAGFFALPDLKIKWTPSKVSVGRSGEMGVTSGAYEMTFNDPSGKQIKDTGKYVTVWKKDSHGKWKVWLDIFNSDAPAT